jgi:hypothetical protein
VKDALRQRAITNRDIHVIWQQIGDDLDFTSAYTVAAAFLAIWAQEYPEEIRQLVDQF